MAGPFFVTLGAVVTLRKPHPCGGRDWTVTRTGADIGLECTNCGRRIMLDREEFERRLLTPRDPEASGTEGVRSAESNK